MASDPTFATTLNMGAAIIGTAETSLTAPAQSSTIITAGSNGTRVEEVVIEAVTTSLTPTTVAGLIYLFLYDGSTYHLYDTVAVTAVTASTTVAPFRTRVGYDGLLIKTGWSLRASQSISGNASLLKVTAIGADF